MNKKTLLILGLLLVIVLAAGTIFFVGQKNAPANNAGAPVGAAGNTVIFACDNDQSVTATFYPKDDTRVDLKLSDGRTLSVPRAISASGARYANSDESFVFWNKGDTAFITEGNVTTYENCALPGTSQVTPSNPIDISGWKTSTDAKTAASIKYPEQLSATYIDTAEWPPQIQITDKPFTCAETGSQVQSGGITQNLTINGRQYCVTKQSEGAAGSVYTQYAYAFPFNGKTATLAFSLRFPQCGNYPDPQKTECDTERAAFDIDALATRIAQTLEIIK